MRIDILTLFPGMFRGPLTESILKRAIDERTIRIELHDIRKWGLGNYRQVDDEPYGGGAGMVMRVDVISKAIEDLSTKNTHRIYFSPRGKLLAQPMIERLAKHDHIILLCGHYEGIDQRIVDGGWIDEEISIGNYVLTGGELPAMIFVDAVARQIPGVLGKDESALEESFSRALGRKLEYPQYTRPEVFMGMKVPDVLLSGNHGEIDKWKIEHTMESEN